MTGLDKTIDQTAMASRVLVWLHVTKDGHLLRRAFSNENEGQSKKRKWKRTWRKEVDY